MQAPTPAGPGSLPPEPVPIPEEERRFPNWNGGLTVRDEGHEGLRLEAGFFLRIGVPPSPLRRGCLPACLKSACLPQKCLGDPPSPHPPQNRGSAFC